MKKHFNEYMLNRITGCIEGGSATKEQLNEVKKQVFDHYTPILHRQLNKMNDLVKQIEETRGALFKNYQDMEKLLLLLGDDSDDEKIQMQIEQLKNINHAMDSIFKDWGGVS